ncbi:MAG: HEPN domain-containing protein [Cellulosilyticaceae bacterium]
MSSFLLLAQSDLAVAHMIMTTMNDELALCKAAYHVQQGVEKILKGLIELNGEDLAGNKKYRTHDIDLLISFLDSGSVPEEIEDRAYKITKWATESRYNINYRVSLKEINTVYQIAVSWLDKILDREE